MKTLLSTPLNRRATQQQGLTLVELLVAMVISLVLVLAAVAALTVARRGFSSVDAASQLRDNGRFAADLIQRLAVQAGYMDVDFARKTCVANSKSCPGPAITGANNARPSASDPLNSWTTRSTGTLGYGSDVLVLRYQTSIRSPAESPLVTDGTMIDCAGNASKAVPSLHSDREFSVLHVGVSSDGEPSLMCTYESQTSPGTFLTQPIIRGVENFQVLYGTDGVTPGLAPTISADLVPDRYLNADQMTVLPSNPAATDDNWRRVRSLRIGMILRGPPGSAQDRQDAPTLYPLGAGTALSLSSDPGSAVTQTAPTDGRLRHAVNFTVHLRNDPGLTP